MMDRSFRTVLSASSCFARHAHVRLTLTLKPTVAAAGPDISFCKLDT